MRPNALFLFEASKSPQVFEWITIGNDRSGAAPVMPLLLPGSNFPSQFYCATCLEVGYSRNSQTPSTWWRIIFAAWAFLWKSWISTHIPCSKQQLCSKLRNPWSCFLNKASGEAPVHPLRMGPRQE